MANETAGVTKKTGNTPEFRQKLKGCLEAQRRFGMSEREIERRLNRSGGYLSKICSGRREIKPDDIESIARAADLPDTWVADLYAAAGWKLLYFPQSGIQSEDRWELLLSQIEAEDRLIGMGGLAGVDRRLFPIYQQVKQFAPRRPRNFDRVQAQVTASLAAAMAFAGKLGDALPLYVEAEHLWRRLGDCGGHVACLTMQALLDQLLHPDHADNSEATLSLVYHDLCNRHELREIAKGHTARDLAWSRRQVNPDDPFVDRCLDRSLDHIAKAEQPSRWERAMTYLEAARTWIDRHYRATQAGRRSEAEQCLARAEEAFVCMKQLLPLAADLQTTLKVERVTVELRFLQGDREAAMERIDGILAVAQEHGLGLQIKEVQTLQRRLQKQPS